MKSSEGTNSKYMAVNYGQLVDVSGTIWNIGTGKAYSSAQALAADMGVPVNGIQWSAIPKNPNWKPGNQFGGSTPPPVVTPPQPVAPSTPMAGGSSQPSQPAPSTPPPVQPANPVVNPNAPNPNIGTPQTVNFMNEQVQVNAQGQPVSTAPITSSTKTPSGALQNVQTGPSTPYTPAANPTAPTVPNAPVTPSTTDPAAPTVPTAPGLTSANTPEAAAPIDSGDAQKAYDAAVQGVYQGRPDLQELYTPTGEAINPQDPRVAGIPTLNDWVKNYGIHEDQGLAGAYGALNASGSASAGGQAGSTGEAGLATGGTGGMNSEVAKTLSDWGIDPTTVADSLSGGDPVKVVNDVYQKIYADLGVASAKKQYDDYNKQLLDLKNEKTDKLVEINDNPWYTEGKRVGELKKLDEKYALRENNLLGYLQLNQSIYESGIQQAQFVTQQAMGLIVAEQNFERTMVTAAIEHVQKRADARFEQAQGQPFYKYSGSDTVYSTATGKPFSSQEAYKAAGGTDFTDVFEIASGNAGIEKTAVLEMMSAYKDAGILPTDSLEVAERKLKTNSALYRKDAYIAPSGGGGGITPYQALQVQNQVQDNLRQDPAIKAYGELVNFGVPNVLDQYYAGTADNIGDTVLMRTLAKVTDPSTGVREEEYRTFEEAQGALGRLYAMPKSWVGRGRLTDTGRAAMIREIDSRFKARLNDYGSSYQYYNGQAQGYGLSVPPPFQLSPAMQQRLTSYGPASPSAPVPEVDMRQVDTGVIGNSFWNNLSSLFGGAD